MLFPKMLREFADRLEGDPENCDIELEHYSVAKTGSGKPYETIELRIILPIEESN